MYNVRVYIYVYIVPSYISHLIMWLHYYQSYISHLIKWLHYYQSYISHLIKWLHYYHLKHHQTSWWFAFWKPGASYVHKFNLVAMQHSVLNS